MSWRGYVKMLNRKENRMLKRSKTVGQQKKIWICINFLLLQLYISHFIIVCISEIHSIAMVFIDQIQFEIVRTGQKNTHTQLIVMFSQKMINFAIDFLSYSLLVDGSYMQTLEFSWPQKTSCRKKIDSANEKRPACSGRVSHTHTHKAHRSGLKKSIICTIEFSKLS